MAVAGKRELTVPAKLAVDEPEGPSSKKPHATKLVGVNEIARVVQFDVGGMLFKTSVVCSPRIIAMLTHLRQETLKAFPDSMLGSMFSGRHQLAPQPDGSFFLDRDGFGSFLRAY